MKKFILVSILIAFFSCNKVDIPKPNVIIIYADDLGYGDVSSYGLGTLQTPNIDKIANNGIKPMIRKLLGKLPFSFQRSTDSGFLVFQGLTTQDFEANFIAKYCIKLMVRKPVSICVSG